MSTADGTEDRDVLVHVRTTISVRLPAGMTENHCRWDDDGHYDRLIGDEIRRAMLRERDPTSWIDFIDTVRKEVDR